MLTKKAKEAVRHDVVGCDSRVVVLMCLDKPGRELKVEIEDGAVRNWGTLAVAQQYEWKGGKLFLCGLCRFQGKTYIARGWLSPESKDEKKGELEF